LAVIKLKYECSTPISRHVIFIHGLDGDVEKTWQSSSKDKIFWPKWLGEDIVGTAIWSVGYKADKTRWSGGQAMHPVDRGINILELLLTEPKLKNGEIIFIGHSLGGLIIKRLLRQADSEATYRSEVQQFITQVRKVAFLGTPHLGSKFASASDFFRSITRPSKATAAMTVGDPYLIDLNNWYKKWSTYQGTSHLVLIESELTKIAWKWKEQIVSPISADPGLKETAIPVDADHESICKPPNKESEIYIFIKNFISSQPTTEHKDKVTEKKLNTILSSIEVHGQSSINSFKDVNTKLDCISDTTAQAVTERLQQAQYLNSSELLVFSGYINQKITVQLTEILLSRFFFGYPTIEKANQLADELLDKGSLVGDTNKGKCIALAWCSRLLIIDESSRDKAIKCLDRAKKIASGQEELLIAEAFLLFKSQGLDDAISSLMADSTPMRMSAAFMMLSQVSTSEAITWKEESDISLNQFDSDGKVSYLAALFACEKWDIALKEAISIDLEELEQNPALQHLVAMSHLLETVPIEFRTLVSSQIPMISGEFPLKSDSKSLEHRRISMDLFDKSSVIANNLGCIEISEILADYSLWLRLKDFQTRDNALTELQLSLDSIRENPELALRRLPLVDEFEIKLDHPEIESAVDRLTTRTRGKSRVAAIARFYLIPLKPSPSEALNYLIKHKENIKTYISIHAFLNLEIQLLAKVGRIKEAKYIIDQFVEETKNTVVASRFYDLLALEQGEDALELYIERFKENDSYDELIRIVRLLLGRKDYERANHYAIELFQRSQNITNAIYILEAKSGLNAHKDISDFLIANSDLMEQSDTLRTHLAWNLYHNGNLRESKIQLDKVKQKTQNSNIRHLEVNLSITSGDWDSLSLFIEGEWQNRNQRSAADLLFAANFAEVILPKRADQLITEATKKEKNNPEVLTAAYCMAGNLGKENNPNVGDWMRRASELSGENGPVRTFSIKELIEFTTEKKKGNDNIWELYIDGQAPTSMVGHYLNKTLADFYLTPCEINKNESDLRRKCLIPAFSNVRTSYEIEIENLALDPTAILTLGNLGMLERLFNSIEHITIPHLTLYWLFNEKKRSAFHQPSRIENARKIMQLMGNKLNTLEALQPKNVGLAIEVGEELASLLMEASALQHDDTRQRLVVRVNPVHKSGTLMDTTVELLEHSHCLVSCISIVEKLKIKGSITSGLEEQALSYLHLQDKKWPTEPHISDDAVLLLDGLSITYLHHTGILDKLSSAGFTCLIHEHAIQEYSSLLSHEIVTKKISQNIDDIRIVLSEFIESGKITIAPVSVRTITDPVLNHPSMELFDLDDSAEAIVSDDRFFNKHKHIPCLDSTKPILTTLDVLDMLYKMQTISRNEMFSARTQLRQFGYIFIPIDSEELNYHLSNAQIINGKLQETAELKAIRENLLLIKLSRFVQLPRDSEWQSKLWSNLIKALKDQWSKDMSEDLCIACSEWILKLIDYRGWSQCFNDESGSELSNNGTAMLLNTLLFVPQDADKKNQQLYWNWLENNVIEPFKHSDPATFNSLVSFSKKLIVISIQNLSTNEVL
jgi:hypothetical protein